MRFLLYHVYQDGVHHVSYTATAPPPIIPPYSMQTKYMKITKKYTPNPSEKKVVVGQARNLGASCRYYGTMKRHKHNQALYT